MVPQGLYLLGNDSVLEQMQAVIASLPSPLAGKDAMPICIIPFDDEMTETEAWIAQQENVRLFDNATSLRKWETFYEAVWVSQPVAHRLSKRYAPGYGNVRSARKFCAFDGPFQRFVVYDVMQGLAGMHRSVGQGLSHAAETQVDCSVAAATNSQETVSQATASSAIATEMLPLASNLAPVDLGNLNLPQFLSQLDRYDLIVEDWEWLKPNPGAAVDLDYLTQVVDGSSSLAGDGVDSGDGRDAGEGAGDRQADLLRNRLHGAQFFAARAQLFSPELLTQLCKNLLEGGETRWLNTLRWWDEAALFSYMTLRVDAKVLNRTRAKASVHPLMAFEQALCS